MSDPDESLGLDQAYAVETPDDNRALYAQWADTFESDFIEPRGYVYHTNVVEQFAGRGGSGPVLDVGCGTGIVGQALRTSGITPVDGVDISPEMLAKAAEKRTDAGDPVYRSLTVADLTAGTPFDAGAYAGVISVGTFTHGHLGPEPLHELYRVAAPGARFAIGVNAEFFVEKGFAEHFDTARAAGTISDYELVEVRMYTKASDAKADDTAKVVLFTRK